MLTATVVSIVIGCIKDGFPAGLIDGVSIFLALSIISAVNSVNNIVSENKLRDLISISKVQEVGVFRNSLNAQTIDSRDLVVGDVYIIQ